MLCEVLTMCSSPSEAKRHPCISLVGMAGAGKSTVGRALAEQLGWRQVDTDSLIEAYFGAPLQAVFDHLGYDAFLDAEEQLVAELSARRCIVSTGGSVVYRQRAVDRLRELGPVVFLRVRYETTQQRVEPQSHRGLAIRPGQTLHELYLERQPLYEQAAGLIIQVDGATPEECARQILQQLDLPAGAI